MKRKIKTGIAQTLFILIIGLVGCLIIDDIFIQPINDIFETNPVTFNNIMCVITMYLIFFCLIWGFYKLVHWILKNI